MAYSKTKYLQNKFIEALEKSLGIVTTACKTAGINRQTYYNWMEKHPDFAARVKEIEDITLDFAESQLHKQIKDGEVSATIFYLKCKGKRRGYIDKTESDITITQAPQPTYLDFKNE